MKPAQKGPSLSTFLRERNAKFFFFDKFFPFKFFFVQQHKNIIKSKQLQLHESIIKIKYRY